jgi:hypothetical protein
MLHAMWLPIYKANAAAILQGWDLKGWAAWRHVTHAQGKNTPHTNHMLTLVFKACKP